MVAKGADIIDVGGESTRPGAEGVGLAEELERVVPFIREFARTRQALISVDTRKAAVAQAALEAGAHIVNTVSGLRDDDAFIDLVVQADVPVIVMHMRGTPQTMQENPYYVNPCQEIIAELEALLNRLFARGLKKERVILDPGIGFGKRVIDNLSILKNLAIFKALGYPLLVGLSRKSFLGAITGRPVEERLSATIACHALALWAGADILRVHDVAEAVDTLKIVQALLEA